MAVTRSELVLMLMKRYPTASQADIELLLKTILNEISQALVDGNRIELRGFGAFSTRKRDARSARNPKNGATVTVGERYSIYYRAGKELRDQLNAKES